MIENIFQYALNIYNIIHIFYPQTNLEQEEQQEELENKVITRQTNNNEFIYISNKEPKTSHKHLIGKIGV